MEETWIKELKRTFKEDWIPILSLAFYDLWLLAFPLQGYFFLEIKKSSAFSYFIIPHALSFFVITTTAYKMNFEKLSLFFGLITSALTILFVHASPVFQKLILFIIGFTSAFLIVRIACGLKRTRDPLLSSAVGLIIGNILLGFLLYLNIPKSYFFYILGILLCIQIWLKLYSSSTNRIGKFFKYLPFVFFFYLLIGNFYVGLMPLYLKYLYCKGIELGFYILAIIFSVKLYKKREDLSLSAGIGAGIFAVAFLHYINRLTINLSMYFVQMAAGFMDVFCFGTFLKEEDPLRSFSLGAGFMLLGPALGFPVLYYYKWTPLMSIGGNIILGFALLIFYFSQTKIEKVKKEHVKESPKEGDSESDLKMYNIPEDMFSLREKDVLNLLMKGLTIKEISKELNISESTVKTYLHRIYRKLKVSSKAELFNKLSSYKNQKIVKLRIVKKS